MQNQPLVSVLMTAYNREKYIAEAIESVIASTYENWELIIVDDQSKDRTIEIAKSYEVKDNRIKVYLNEKNLGDYPNRNKAAELAKGKYIKYLDSDDLIYPHGLQVMLEAMEKFPEAEIGMSFNNYEEKMPLPIIFSSEQSFRYHFFYKGLLYIGPSGCIYRKDYFDNIGGFDPQFKVAADYHFNLRAASQNKIVLFNRDLIWWRQHEGQEIINSSRNNEYIVFNYQIHQKTLSNSKIDEHLKQIILYNDHKLMARRLIKMLLKLKFNSFMSVYSKTHMPFKYFILALIPNKKIK